MLTFSQFWQGILLKEMVQANFVIVEGAECAILVENEGEIGYHRGNLT